MMFNLINKYMVLSMISILLLILFLMVGVAFLTLLERKILGYVQNRKGPNKVGYLGIMQPFSEAIKLFSKEIFVVNKSNFKLFFFSPVMSMFLLMMVLLNYPFCTNIYFMNYSVLLIILMLSLNSYLIMMMGWSSNSLYAMIGSMRSVAQMLSYEVSFFMVILIQLILSESYVLIDLCKWQIYLGYFWMMFPLLIVFFISVLSELNRSPMDFIEGESELVSGFNVEYYSGSFALIFLAEYGMIIFMSYFMVILYMGIIGSMMMVVLMNFLILMVIFMRGILPRMRYDELMYLCWKVILPLVLNYFLMFFFLKIGVVLIL